MKKLIFVCLIFPTLIYISPCSAQNAVFDIDYTGFSPDAEIAFNYAADLWSNYLISDVPIKVKAHMTFLLPGQLGITFPNGELNFTAAPINNVWYASCLANAISGIEINTGEADMEIYLNIAGSWYYGLDGNPVAGQYDFISTALHEICHGLGFLSLANKIGDEGSFGLIDSSAFAPLTTSFTWPDLDTLPSVFDYYLETEGGTQLVTFTNPSTELESEFTGGSTYFSSSNVLEDNGGLPGRIYATSTFTLGSSLTHWNEASYPVGNANELMTPQAAPAHASHTPGPLTLAVLDDIGWEINYDTVYTDIKSPMYNEINIYPNPVNDILFIGMDKAPLNSSLQIFNYDGKAVSEKLDLNEMINLSNLRTGVYLLKIKTENGYLLLAKTIIKL